MVNRKPTKKESITDIIKKMDPNYSDAYKPVKWNLKKTKDSKHFTFGTWDIEAANWWDLKLIGLYDGTDYLPFTNIEDFLDIILSRKYRNWHWFAHFGGRYDVNFIFDYIRKFPEIYETSFYCSGSMVLRLTIKRGRYSCHLLDSYRLLPAKLADLTTSFNVEHKKGSIDFDKIELNEELLTYNESDCRGLYEVITKLYKKVRVQADTYASLSMAYWKKNYLKQELLHPSDEVKEFIRAGYHGGRVEVFKHEGYDINAFDVNSMYPFCMTERVPYLMRSKCTNIEIDDMYYGFANAIVEVPDMYIPPLPVRLDRLYFPVGRLVGTWSFEELREAQRRGCTIIRILDGYSFYTDYLFKEFVKDLYEWKVSGDETNRSIAKFLLNSLYGKFGQMPEKEMYCLERNAPEGSTPILDANGIPTEFAKYKKISSASHLLPHISAAITSKARLELLKMLDERSYYCDTDSCFTTKTIPIWTKKLGSWEPQGKGHGIFFQPKLYYFEGKWKAKGINSKEQDVQKFIDGEPNVSTRHRSVKEALSKGIDACSSIEISKVYRDYQSKRAWINGKKDTRPWNIKEILK
jgi:hypothetical protein